MLIAAGFTEIYTGTLISRILFKRNWTFEYLPKDQMTRKKLKNFFIIGNAFSDL